MDKHLKNLLTLRTCHSSIHLNKQSVSIQLTAFQAQQGDSLLLTYRSETSETNYIIIDAGLASSYHRTLGTTIGEIFDRGEHIDLAIISHYDNDHILGFIPLLKEFGVSRINRFWFNYYPQPFSFPGSDGAIGVKEAIHVRDYLREHSKTPEDDVCYPQTIDIEPFKFTILSPTADTLEQIKASWEKKESKLSADPKPIGNHPDDKHRSIEELSKMQFFADNSLSNKSSIAFVLRLAGKALLLTSDSNPRTLASSIKGIGYSEESPLFLDLMQVSHHGSSKNTDEELLSLIACQNFLVSTNPVNGDNFPHKESLSRIVTSAHKRDCKNGVTFHFNYDHPSLRKMFSAEEIAKYQIKCNFPAPDDKGITITF